MKKRDIEIQYEPKQYSSTAVCKMLNIKRITLQKWISEGYIQPYIKSSGTGTSNYFDQWNLYQIKLFMLLLSSGLSRDEAARRIKQFEPSMVAMSEPYDTLKPSQDGWLKKAQQNAEWKYEEDSNDRQLKIKWHIQKPQFFMFIRKNKEYEGRVFFEGDKITVPTEQDVSEIHIINIQGIFE